MSSRASRIGAPTERTPASFHRVPLGSEVTYGLSVVLPRRKARRWDFCRDHLGIRQRIQSRPLLFRKLEHHGFARRRRGDQIMDSGAGSDLQPFVAGDLVDIDDRVAIPDTQEGRATSLLGDAFDMGSGDARKRHLLKGRRTELNELRPESVPAALGGAQEADPSCERREISRF
jgi:hypothetical protein